MKIDLMATEEAIVAKMKEQCGEEFRFKAIAHPGSLMTLGQPINAVTALVRFLDLDNDQPANLNVTCPSFKTTVRYEINILYNDLRSHLKLYDLAKALCKALRGQKLLVFCEGELDTQLYSWVTGLQYVEIAEESNGCYGYSFQLRMCYMDTYRVSLT